LTAIATLAACPAGRRPSAACWARRGSKCPSCGLFRIPVHTVGFMFWLSRNRLVGSYWFLRATSRS
jgi:hypothetical protein